LSNLLLLTKRQYTNKDLIDDKFGRIREIPLELARNGHNVTGLCLSYAQREEGWTRDELVSWKSINATRWKLPGLVAFFLEAFKLSRRADIVWAGSDSFYGIIGQFLAFARHIPVVFDLYDNFEYFFVAKLPLVKQLYRWTVRHCDAVICISRPLAALIKSYGRKHGIYVLENAVRADLFRPMDKADCRGKLGLPADCTIIGTAGALTKNRGIRLLFEAFEILQKTHRDLHLAVAGPRNIPMPHGRKIHDVGILELKDVPVFLNALDVAVVCNQHNEFGKYCFPQKTREIMACNIPIIAADVGSMSEMFSDKPDWLYDPDNVSSLVNAIEQRLTNRSTDYASSPTWADLAGTLENIFSTITHGHNQSGST
jgi:teichuronic acid biosynthesis glycosyltransferase TuaC